MEDIEERIKGLFVKFFQMEPQEVTLEVNLKNDLEMDSTEVVELVLALEKEFNIRIGDSEITNRHCVGDIVNIVKSKLEQ